MDFLNGGLSRLNSIPPYLLTSISPPLNLWPPPFPTAPATTPLPTLLDISAVVSPCPVQSVVGGLIVEYVVLSVHNSITSG